MPGATGATEAFEELDPTSLVAADGTFGRSESDLNGRFGYPVQVSPTVLRVRGFRFYFFSREERRPHVHVQHAEGEAKFWIDPTVELHANYGLKSKRLAEAERLVEEHLHEIRSAWAKHFPS